jgi:hypothetical protein
LCGGSSICEHNKIRYNCKQCCGGGICEHNLYKNTCAVCEPYGHLKNVTRCRIYQAFKFTNIQKMDGKTHFDYLGCSIEIYREFLDKKLQNQIVPDEREKMDWSNYGIVWNIDHITPILWTGDGVIDHQILETRLHYSNTQPMYVDLNNKKGNKFIG